MAKAKKRIAQQAITYGSKQAKSIEEPNSFLSKRPSWRFERVDTEYRWSIANAGFSEIILSLRNFERMTWGEIAKQTHDNGKSSNHYVSLNDLCKEAQKGFPSLILKNMQTKYIRCVL